MASRGLLHRGAVLGLLLRLPRRLPRLRPRHTSKVNSGSLPFDVVCDD
jgi:hypothetical protein